ncbi:CheR family methyltransferase [Herbaspirillum rhizosphaerae]|uniref:CheR family methyltransferase n=1 Tax=Herbaspirillum rhizosphaerae TaxID=346179 RepID=UPI00067AA92C|nr:protein-glutamate O-methyltransferase CheR [Herbaspirillum rhizosphaerae]
MSAQLHHGNHGLGNSAANAQVIEQIAAMLKQHMGLDVAAVGSSLIERGVRERMSQLAQNDIYGYLHTLQSGVGELQELIELVVVPETWFFRDREAILAVARLAREKIVRSPTANVRILSLPCSTGEEPYSIAMALLDVGVPAGQFRVDGIDICKRSLSIAQRSIYGRNSFRGKQLEYRERHFSVYDTTASALSEEVRRQVGFRHGNMLAGDFLVNEAPYDFIFCRNVLIYFDRDVQAQAVKVLERLLGQDGCIFVGPAEAGIMLRPHIESIGIPLTFGFRRKAVTVPKAEVMPALPSLAKPIAPAWMPTSAPVRERSKTAAPLPVARPAIEKIVMPAQDDLLTRARTCADRGELAEAEALCAQHLRAAGPNAGAYYLQGLINDARQDTATALQLYRKAIYLQPDHRDALLHLSGLLAAQGDVAGAQRLQQRAERAQLKQGNEEQPHV